jgi:hypothetical protein
MRLGEIEKIDHGLIYFISYTKPSKNFNGCDFVWEQKMSHYMPKVLSYIEVESLLRVRWPPHTLTKFEQFFTCGIKP